MKIENSLVHILRGKNRFSTIIGIAIALPIFLCSSCNLFLNPSTTRQVTVPVFESFSPIGRVVYMDKETNDEKQYFLYLPPIIDWQTVEISIDIETMEFNIMDTSVVLNVTLATDHVSYVGSNESVSLDFSIYNNDGFEYRGLMFSERTNDNLLVNYFDLFKSKVTGVINGNFITGNGVAKAWEIAPAGAYGIGSPENDDSSYIYVTFNVDLETTIPYIDILTFDEQKDSSYFADPTNVTLQDWNAA